MPFPEMALLALMVFGALGILLTDCGHPAILDAQARG